MSATARVLDFPPPPKVESDLLRLADALIRCDLERLAAERVMGCRIQDGGKDDGRIQH